MDVTVSVKLIGFLLLLVASAFSSMSETAITSVNKLRIKQMAMEKDDRAILLEKILEDPSRFLATTLFMNNMVNIGAASLATVAIAEYVPYYTAAVSTGLVTFFVLVYGEITPKTYAAQNADRLALRLIKPVLFLSALLYPIARLLIAIANLFIRLFGGSPLDKGPFVTEEDLKTLVLVGEEAGVIEEEEKEMIHSIFEFGDTMVKEVMVPRIDMVTVSDTASIKDLLEVIVNKGHSRIPAYQETVDNVVGIVYAKDLLAKPRENRLSTPVKDLIHPAYYVLETMKLDDLLREFRKRKTHMAIVVDEYGGTAGLVTIEDVLEEIVGEIFDEYDLEMVMLEKLDDDKIRVDARLSIDEVNEEIGIDLSDVDYETIGGFVYNLIGKIPATGEKVAYDLSEDFRLVFVVEKVINRRISKLLITKERRSSSKEEGSTSGT